MKRWVHSFNVDKDLSQFSAEQIDYVRDCVDDMNEAITDMTQSNYSEEQQISVLNEIRDDWLIGALEDEVLTETEFDELLTLLSKQAEGGIQ